ncbi:aminodeoxychorismate/anthranilate synthase component II [Thermaurantimonas aggregans]|uniref:Aminodeoxychorismate/anthranilate synthase component II n=1 Tax=Thermaurantimonas aggregans TaxID=2173829 RepID=A0A401XL19_9FLAO|nr:aminodeoxychorismate/anthranilate synthase component II [Thermaurantimonas aggregans]MCX8149716.1 aminodeoxychorismate/anthranilate synthase component II [Thermaurantimonas aggregans]GCD77716.1 aminodeoxychorismate/anthranilate synthase component II [Thermaurantimonas aggregans]
MKLLLLDNYDSFTYNLWNYLKMCDVDVEVAYNDQVVVDKIGQYSGIVLSPGPGIPSEAGALMDVISKWAGKRPILGICLGHQAIAEAFGGHLRKLPMPYHGVAHKITFKNIPIFQEIEMPTEVGLYHSWAIESVPSIVEVVAENSENIPMAIYSEHLHLTGLQFHPESIMTTYGLKMIQNWINSL